MATVPQSRQLLYAVLATLVTLGVFIRWSRGSDGGWIFWWAIGLFALLMAIDWLVTARVLDGDGGGNGATNGPRPD